MIEEGISEEKYDRALEMRQRYYWKTLKDYHDLCLTLGVTLLADIFKNFREMALCEYKLDPAHSWTFPGFAWNCALKISVAELELITDQETFPFFLKTQLAEVFRPSVTDMKKQIISSFQITTRVY